MKKVILYLLFAVSFSLSRDLDFRRMNEQILMDNHVENSTTKLEVLKNLSAYDLLQAKLNSGRLFIRDKIILP